MSHFDKYNDQGSYHWRECQKWGRHYNPPLHARYIAIAKRVKGKRVLDAGAGDGFLSALMAPSNVSVTSLEQDLDGHHLAKHLLAEHENIDVVHGSVYDIQFPDNSFDVVVHADVIEHLENPQKAVSEFARVLKPAGVALVSTPQRRPGRLWDSRHCKEYDPVEFRDLLLINFRHVQIVHLWPKRWFDFYETRLGWRALKLAGSLGFNPFVTESISSAGMYQMLAIARLQ